MTTAPERASSDTGPDPDPTKASTFAANRKAVVVIYGHDTQANTALFDWLRAIGLQPREWNQGVRASGSGSPYIGQVLQSACQDSQAVVAFFTPDEYVIGTSAPPEDHNSWRLQARPNVLIEAGMALVTHPTRTVIVMLGDQELPSDLAGRHYVRLSHTAAEPLHDLAGRLQDAGCQTDLTGTDWLNPVRFPDRTDTSQPPRPDHRTAHAGPGNPSQDDARDEAQALQAAQSAKEDADARQVVAAAEKKDGSNFTHLFTVSTPNTYPIKQVEGQIVWQANSGGLAMTGFGFAGDAPHADDRRTYYTFRASVSKQIHAPEPIIRFVDLHGHRYYQYRHHTQRFPQNTDWLPAATAIDQWLRTGPTPD